MIQFTTCLVVFLTHAWFKPVIGGDTYSLTYIYTAFSKPMNLPGIHEFTAMGLLDDRMIDYYDSSVKKKIPKQPWMEKRLDKDYWEKGTQSRQSKEQWFKVNLGILRDRNRHSNDTDLHILQWRHGCKAQTQGDTLTFISGRDEYSYDGDDYLAFDDSNKRWITSVDLAVPTKRKWDEVKMLNDYTQGYLERECVSWLSKFVGYEKEALKEQQKISPPQIYVYGKKCKNPNSIIFHCMATGFYPKDIKLNIWRDGKVVDELDGMQSTGVRPNDDGTYQIKNHVEILRSDEAKYRCEVQHPASNVYEFKDWDVSMCNISGPGNGTTIIVIAVAIAVLLIGIVAVGIIYYQKVLCFSDHPVGLAGIEEMKKLNAPSVNGSESSDENKPKAPSVNGSESSDGNGSKDSNGNPSSDSGHGSSGSASEGSSVASSVASSGGSRVASSVASSGGSSGGSSEDIPESRPLIVGNPSSSADPE